MREGVGLLGLLLLASGCAVNVGPDGLAVGGPCIDEIKSIMSQYKAGGLDPRLEVMDMLFETDTRAPTTEEFARKWQKDLGITFPLAMDPEFQMQKYFQRNAVPVNMLIDLRTMRIHFFQTGVSLSRVGQEMVAFFSRLDNGN